MIPTAGPRELGVSGSFWVCLWVWRCRWTAHQGGVLMEGEGIARWCLGNNVEGHMTWQLRMRVLHDELQPRERPRECVGYVPHASGSTGSLLSSVRCRTCCQQVPMSVGGTARKCSFGAQVADAGLHCLLGEGRSDTCKSRVAVCLPYLQNPDLTHRDASYCHPAEMLQLSLLQHHIKSTPDHIHFMSEPSRDSSAGPSAFP